METTSEKWACWGFGCLVDFAIFIAAVALLDTNAGASFLLYMLMLAIPMAVVRFFFFSDATPRWLRVSLGPIGAIACLVLAATAPLDLSSDGQSDPEPSQKAEAPKESVEDVLAELDSLVGLEGVKAEVKRIVNLAKVNEARRAQGLKVPPMTYHMVFTGNPGTGKTTVARIVARAFRALGIAPPWTNGANHTEGLKSGPRSPRAQCLRHRPMYLSFAPSTTCSPSLRT